MKKHTKYIIFAFVLGLALAVAISVHGAMLLGSKGVIVTPKPDNIIAPVVSVPNTAKAPQQEEIKYPQEYPSVYSQATFEEARLRAIEARLTALEARNK